MIYDHEKVDETVLALLYLNTFTDHSVTRTWKGFDWDTLNRLHEKGYISNPQSKSKSVVLSEEGLKLSEKLFNKHFSKS